MGRSQRGLEVRRRGGSARAALALSPSPARYRTLGAAQYKARLRPALGSTHLLLASYRKRYRRGRRTAPERASLSDGRKSPEDRRLRRQSVKLLRPTDYLGPNGPCAPVRVLYARRAPPPPRALCFKASALAGATRCRRLTSAAGPCPAAWPCPAACPAACPYPAPWPYPAP